MKRLSFLVLVLILLGLAGIAVFLVTWDIPAPSTQIERVVPDDRFPR